ncbi:MAG: hypothetical protein HGN29_09810 [Asgard group archaeon]|nr:hypothetical protein [Asgard group archaeon]
MVEKKTIGTIISVSWLVILIALWVSYQWLPGDIFMWMWIAIGWSFLGGVFGAIFFAARSKRNLLIVCIIWIIILAVLLTHWFYPFIPGVELHWYWVTIAWFISCGVVTGGILTLKLLKKTEW